MIVTCEGCKARFKFDEKRIKPQGIKVHCSKCRHTFTLKPAVSPEQAPVIRVGPLGESRAGKKEPEAPPAPELAHPLESLPDAADDPLADVPGFDPDARSLPAPGDEEEKALAKLWNAESVNDSVDETLERFQATEKAGPGEKAVDSTEGSPDHFDDLDPFGVAELSGQLEAKGAEGEEAGASEDSDPETDSDNFDWESISFTEENKEPKRDPEVPKPPVDIVIEGLDSKALALEEESKDAEASRRLARPQKKPTSPERFESGPDSDSLELDLSNDVRPREPASRGSKPRSSESEVRPAAPRPRSAKPGKKPGKPRVTKRIVQPFRARARQKRPRLALPGLPVLALSAVLGLAAAAVGAILAYGPFGGDTYVARPVGEDNVSVALSIEHARGVMVNLLDGGSRYVITGKARWESEPARGYILEGVITGPGGEVLERRTARLGAMPDWKVIEKVDPELFAASESVPREGEIPFTVLFTPDPAWRGDVHFELAADR